MKYHTFKERCDYCGCWTYTYDTSTGKLVCDKCMKTSIAKKIELDDPVQLSFRDVVGEVILSQEE